MNTLGIINNKYSRGTIKLASEGINKAWLSGVVLRVRTTQGNGRNYLKLTHGEPYFE